MVPVDVRVVLGNEGECDKAKVVPVVCEYPEQRRLPRSDTHPPSTAGIEVFFGQRPLKVMLQVRRTRGIHIIYQYVVPPYCNSTV